MDLNITTTNESHISQIINIYSYYILNTPVTFEVEIPEYNEFKNRVDTIQEKDCTHNIPHPQRNGVCKKGRKKKGVGHGKIDCHHNNAHCQP